MLRIRDEQVQTLRKSLTEDVEDELFDDVKKFFQERYSFLGEAQTRIAVRHGMARASSYGFTSLRGLALYVTMSFVLGSHFDKNPLYPWARKNLVDDRDLVETTRTHRFYNALRRYLRAARDGSGIYNEPIIHYAEALNGVQPQATGAFVEDRLVEQLRTIALPQFEEAGEDRVREIIRVAIERAGERGIMTSAGLSVYVPLTFLLGVHFDEDPQFPWAIDACLKRDGDAPENAAIRLHQGALDFRRHCLTFITQPTLS